MFLPLVILAGVRILVRLSLLLYPLPFRHTARTESEAPEAFPVAEAVVAEAVVAEQDKFPLDFVLSSDVF